MGGLAACTASDSPMETESDPIVLVEIVPDEVEMVAGTTRELTVRVVTESGADVASSATVTWSSIAQAVATVNGNGAAAIVSAVAHGLAEIRASAGGVNGSAQVFVSPPPPEVTTTSLPAGQVGVTYDETLQATGGDGAYSWSVTSGSLPNGISLDADAGTLSGIPAVAGIFDFTVRVTSTGGTDEQALSLEISPGSLGTTTVVVNVDFMTSVLPQFGDVVFDGDNAVFSTAGGTTWNPSDPFTSITDARDEFGQITPVDMVENLSGGRFIGGAPNELQDNGVITGAVPGDGLRWEGLLEAESYDLAFYVHHEAEILVYTEIDVTHGGGVTTLTSTGNNTYALPGDIGKDYLLLEDVTPVEIRDGVWGFVIGNFNEEGTITGLQLRGPVPAAGGAPSR